MNATKISWEEVDQISGGDQSFRNEIKNIILTELPEELHALSRAHQTQALDEVAFYLHKMKHKFSLMGLTDDTQTIKDLECQFREGKCPDIQQVNQMAQKIIEFVKE